MSLIKATLDEIVEEVMALYHRYDGENKCTLEKTSHELGDDEPMECSCDYTDRLRKTIEKFVVEEEIPFDKALDRASLNAFDRMEFIKGANWAKGFLTTPKKGGDDE